MYVCAWTFILTRYAYTHRCTDTERLASAGESSEAEASVLVYVYAYTNTYTDADADEMLMSMFMLTRILLPKRNSGAGG